VKNAAAKQVEFGAAIHLPLEQFEPVDLALDRTIAPRLRQGGLNRRKVADNSGDKAVQCRDSRSRQPSLARCRIPLAQNTAEFICCRRCGGYGEQACRASARGHAPGGQRGVSVYAGGIEAAAPNGPPPDDVVPAIEPPIAQLAPQLGTVVAPLGPAPLHILKMPIKRTRSWSAAVYRRLAGTQPAAHGVAEHGRMGWQKASGYNRRALAEATIGRFKRVIGDRLRSHTDQRQATEMTVAVAVLNRMLELGRPKSVRIT
jgi:hypothetical protein